MIYLVQEVHNSLVTHHCSANAFEIAYWQERQKLSEVLEANKALALHLEEAQSRNYYYEYTVIPNYRRIENSLQSKLTAFQKNGSLATNVGQGETTDEQAQVKQVARDNARSSLAEFPSKLKQTSVDGIDIAVENMKKRSNRMKLRRIAEGYLE